MLFQRSLLPGRSSECTVSDFPVSSQIVLSSVKPWSITTAGRGCGSPHGTVTSTDSGMPSKLGTVPRQRGRMPETRALPDPWWSTPNIHLCTLRDFIDLCTSLDLRIDACTALSGGKPARPIDPANGWENWRSETALFLLSKRAADTTGQAPVDLFGDVALEPQAAAPPARRRRKI